MELKINKNILVQMIREACSQCTHKECIDCIFRYVKKEYSIIPELLKK